MDGFDYDVVDALCNVEMSFSCLSSFSAASVVVRSLLFSLFVAHFGFLLLGILHVSR